jgi:hypothetical protein
MFTMHRPLSVHDPLLLCPSCETAALCRTDREARRKRLLTVLVCPSCGVYHSIDSSATGCALYASPVAG